MRSRRGPWCAALRHRACRVCDAPVQHEHDRPIPRNGVHLTLRCWVRPTPEIPKVAFLSAWSKPSLDRYVEPKRDASVYGGLSKENRKYEESSTLPSAQERFLGSWGIRCLTFLPDRPILGELGRECGKNKIIALARLFRTGKGKPASGVDQARIKLQMAELLGVY